MPSWNQGGPPGGSNPGFPSTGPAKSSPPPKKDGMVLLSISGIDKPLEPNKAYTVKVTVLNTGKSIWHPDAVKPQGKYRLIADSVYEKDLLNHNSPQNKQQKYGYVNLPKGTPVGPNKKHTFTFNILTPDNTSSANKKIEINFMMQRITPSKYTFGDAAISAGTKKLFELTIKPSAKKAPTPGPKLPHGLGDATNCQELLTAFSKFSFEEINQYKLWTGVSWADFLGGKWAKFGCKKEPFNKAYNSAKQFSAQKSIAALQKQVEKDASKGKVTSIEDVSSVEKAKKAAVTQAVPKGKAVQQTAAAAKAAKPPPPKQTPKYDPQAAEITKQFEAKAGKQPSIQDVSSDPQTIGPQISKKSALQEVQEQMDAELAYIQYLIKTSQISANSSYDYFFSKGTYIAENFFNAEDFDPIRILTNNIWKKTQSAAAYGYENNKISIGAGLVEKYVYWIDKKIKKSFRDFYISNMTLRKEYRDLSEEQIVSHAIHDTLATSAEFTLEKPKTPGEKTFVRIDFKPLQTSQAERIGAEYAALAAINELSGKIPLDTYAIDVVRSIIKRLDKAINDGDFYKDYSFRIKPLTYEQFPNFLNKEKIAVEPSYNFFSGSCDEIPAQKHERSLPFAYTEDVEPAPPATGLDCDSPILDWEPSRVVLFTQDFLNKKTKKAFEQKARRPKQIRVKFPTLSKISEEQVSNAKIASKISNIIFGKSASATQVNTSNTLKKFMAVYQTTKEKEVFLRGGNYPTVEENCRSFRKFDGAVPIEKAKLPKHIENISSQSGLDFNVVDAIMTYNNGKTYMFNENFYYRYNDAENRVDSGYPRSISKNWKGIPENLDAAFVWPGNNKAYFFKGTKYWRFDSAKNEVEQGYPKSITQNWKGLPSAIDAVFVWGGNGVTYFVKGKNYYRWNDKLNRVDDGYPRLLSEWKGIPNNISAAFTYGPNKKTYFFKGTKYYRYDNVSNAVEAGFENGKDIATNWPTKDADYIPTDSDFSRTYKDVLDGKFSKIEMVGYRVAKHRDAPDPLTSVVQDEIQSFFIPYSEKNGLIDILDTQVKYNEPYYYTVTAVLIVYGTEYKYGFPQMKFQSGKIDKANTTEIAAKGELEFPSIKVAVDEIRQFTTLVEVPLIHRNEQKDVRVLVEPPTVPNINVQAYKGVNNKVLFLFEEGIGIQRRKIEEPEPNWEELKEYIERTPNVPEELKKNLSKDEMVFSGISKLSKFLLYRLEKEPTSLRDFIDNAVPIEIDSFDGAYIDTVIPNKKYYYVAKSVNVNGDISYMTEIYSVEIVDDGGVVFPVINLFKIRKEDTSKKSKTFRNKLRIRPSFIQSAPNKDKMVLKGPDSKASGGQGDKDAQDHQALGFVEGEDNIVFSNKNIFKFRVTSNKTGRKIDLNIRFDKDVRLKKNPQLDSKQILVWQKNAK